MQLTNYSFLESRRDYLSAQSLQKTAMQRLSTGTKLERSGSDTGALSQSMRGRLEKMADRTFITNLQNTKSFLQSQQSGLLKTREIYGRMETLSIRAMDPTSSGQDRADYNDEFKSLTEQLNQIMKSKFNGRNLFNDTLVCGGSKDIPLGQLDLAGGKPAGVNHAIRAQEIDVNSPAGTLSFRVNSGTAGDIYRVWMGGTCVFSAGNAFNGPDPTLSYDDPAGFAFPGNGWRTSTSASTDDDDLIEVTFEPGKPTTYTVTPGQSNDDGNGNSAFNSITDPVNGTYGNIITNDLPPGATSTMLTLQIETTSIGIIYAKGDSANNDADGSGTPAVSFVPKLFETSVPLDIHGNEMTLDPKGFGTLDGASPVTKLEHSIDTAENAGDTLNHLRGNPYSEGSALSYFGEEKCILDERLSSVGAEISRLDLEIERQQNQVTLGEQSNGRISDADMAREATQLARHSLKMNLAEQIMSKSSRIKDVLIPLTTNHYRSSVMSSTL
jgi:flagellin-like hook-associated protein FlgL